MNRGFGGYTSSTALALLDRLLPRFAAPNRTDPRETADDLSRAAGNQVARGLERRRLLVGIFFGANDACGSDHYMVRSERICVAIGVRRK